MLHASPVTTPASALKCVRTSAQQMYGASGREESAYWGRLIMEEDPALQKRATDRAKEVRARTMIRASNSAFSIFSTGTTQHAPSPSTISRPVLCYINFSICHCHCRHGKASFLWLTTTLYLRPSLVRSINYYCYITNSLHLS